MSLATLPMDQTCPPYFIEFPWMSSCPRPVGPHLAHDITYNSGGQVIPRDFAQMKPGDVIGFSYTPGGHVFHVGIYLGDTTFMQGPRTGAEIRV